MTDFIFILLQKLLGVAQYLTDGDVLHTCHIFFARARTFVLAARVTGLRRLEKHILRVVRIKARHRARAEHRDDGHVHRDADVHGAGIRRDKERALSEKCRQLCECDASCKRAKHLVVAMAHLGSAGGNERFVHGAAEEGDAIAFFEKIVRDRREVVIEPTLRLPARTDVQGDDLLPLREGFTPELRGAFFRSVGQPHLETAVVDALDADGFLQHVEVGMDLVLDRLLVFHDLVEKGREKGLCIADDAPCTREGRERRSALVAVQVDDEVEMLLADAADEAQKSERMIIRSLFIKQETAVDMLVADDEIGELLVREKRDARLRKVRSKRAQYGRHEHEVADVHEVDDEDVVVIFLLHRKIPFWTVSCI